MLQAADAGAWQALQESFGGAELERPTARLLESIFDHVEHRGGPAEEGADFVCGFVGPLGIEFGVAIQVKMWTGTADDQTPLRQLERAARAAPVSAAALFTTAEATSASFDAAACALAQRIRVPVRVICRDEFMKLLTASTCPGVGLNVWSSRLFRASEIASSAGSCRVDVAPVN